MKVYTEMEARDFKPWAGAISTWDDLTAEEKEAAFDAIEELFCGEDAISETDINDILWFEDEWLCEAIGIDYENDFCNR